MKKSTNHLVSMMGLFLVGLFPKNIIPPNKELNPITKKNYAGGYLFCPKTGIYNYMFDEDLNITIPINYYVS